LVGLWFKPLLLHTFLKYDFFYLALYKMENLTEGSVALSIKQVSQKTSYEKEIGKVTVGSSNNYASCYAIPISTPRPSDKKGHNGPHQSHYTKS
jgi:hypothetical protein